MLLAQNHRDGPVVASVRANDRSSAACEVYLADSPEHLIARRLQDGEKPSHSVLISEASPPLETPSIPQYA